MEKYAQNLKELRKALKFSVKRLSEEIGLPESTLWGYEGGKRIPSIELPMKLTKKLNVNANWFLTGNGPMFNDQTGWMVKKENIKLSQFTEEQRLKLLQLIE